MSKKTKTMFNQNIKNKQNIDKCIMYQNINFRLPIIDRKN